MAATIMRMMSTTVTSTITRSTSNEGCYPRTAVDRDTRRGCSRGLDHLHERRVGLHPSVPDGFVNRPQTTDSSGAVFGGPGAEIMVWGEPLDEADLEAKGDAVLGGFFGAGWNMMSQTFTPQSVSLELRKGATVLHVRIIPVCEGKAVAQYRLGYGTSDVPKLGPIQDEMVTEFRANGVCSAI
jgi:hypothetical protein